MKTMPPLSSPVVHSCSVSSVALVLRFLRPGLWSCWVYKDQQRCYFCLMAEGEDPLMSKKRMTFGKHLIALFTHKFAANPMQLNAAANKPNTLRLWNWTLARTLVLVFATVGLTMMVGAMPAYASSGVGQYPYTPPYYCSMNSMPLYSVVHFSGPTLGYLKLERSNACGTTWVHFASADSSKWDLDVSMWHPGQPSTQEWSLYNAWMDTTMIAVIPGVQNCMGAQVYVHNGPWIGWYFGGCWAP